MAAAAAPREATNPSLTRSRLCGGCGKTIPAGDAFCSFGCEQCKAAGCDRMLPDDVNVKVCGKCGTKRYTAPEPEDTKRSRDRSRSASRNKRKEPSTSPTRGRRGSSRDRRDSPKHKKGTSGTESSSSDDGTDERRGKKEKELREAARRLTFVSLADVRTERMRTDHEVSSLLRGKASEEKSLRVTKRGEFRLKSGTDSRNPKIETWEQASARFDVYRRAVRAAYPDGNLPDLMELYWDRLSELADDGVPLNALLRCDVRSRTEWSVGRKRSIRAAAWGSVNNDYISAARNEHARTQAANAATSHDRGSRGGGYPRGAAGGAAAAEASASATGRGRRRERGSQPTTAKVRKPKRSHSPAASRRSRTPEPTREKDAAAVPATGDRAKPPHLVRCSWDAKPGGCNRRSTCKFAHNKPAA
jgi:hypothetical protein